MTGSSACRLCGEAVDGSERFCSSGCRAVHGELGSPAEGDGPSAGGPSPIPEGHVRTFLRVDGMHSRSCEAYLEALATAEDGVADAEASYVTETVRVDHVPDRIGKDDLRRALSRTGYEAYLREDAATADGDGRTRRSREVTGLRSRRSRDMLQGRYIAGVMFGLFVMVHYLTILYPAHLRFLYDDVVLSVFDRALASPAAMIFFLVLSTLTGLVFWFTGAPLIRGSYVGVRMRRANTESLVALAAAGAFVYGLIAIGLGRTDVYHDLTIAIVVVTVAAIYYESLVKRLAVDELSALTVSEVGEARLEGSGDRVPVEEVEPGDRVLVRAGERIPVDGVLAEGECAVDEAVITGENLPVAKRAGDELVGGSAVLDGAAVCEAGSGSERGIDRLTATVWNLQSADHGVGRRADELAGRAVPAVLGLAVLVGIGTAVLGASPIEATLASLATLFVCTPWVVGFATPLSVAASVREATRRGIVVFDESVLERLRGVDVVVFDKTGTLTTGSMAVLDVELQADALEMAAALERRSAHPAARAVVAAAEADRGETDGGVERGDVSAFRTHATGVGGRVDGRTVLVGHPELFEERGWSIPETIRGRLAAVRADGRLPVVVGRDGHAEGVVVLGDEPREGWAETMTALHDRGIETVVLTGDHGEAAAFAREHPGVDHVFADVPPAGKAAAIRRLRERGTVAMVGDGTNDAPALAAADLGIALGSGTALASDAADLAVVGEGLAAVETAFDLASAAGRRLRENVALALSYNAVVIPAALLGVLSPPAAFGATVLAASLVAANAERSLVGGDR